VAFEEERKGLVAKLVQRGYITNSQVILAMESVPRHLFLPDESQKFAHSDTPLNIGQGQTISAPHMVGMMLELMELKKGMTVLEVGGGSGYHAALISYIVGGQGHVYTIEIIESLAKLAEHNITAVGLHDRVTVINGDGSRGLPEEAPFERITAACSAPEVPEPLVEQLTDPGIMVIPVGSGYLQNLILVKKENGEVTRKDYGGVAFVPMRGEHGFD